MQFYPLNITLFANLSVSASVATSASFIEGRVPTSSFALSPVGPKGDAGTDAGVVYKLSSDLLVCSGTSTTTTTTTTTAPTTTTTTTTTTSTTTSTTTTTTTLPPTCGGGCTVPGPFDIDPCGTGCVCTPLYEGSPLGRCEQQPIS